MDFALGVVIGILVVMTTHWGFLTALLFLLRQERPSRPPATADVQNQMEYRPARSGRATRGKYNGYWRVAREQVGTGFPEICLRSKITTPFTRTWKND